MTIPKPKHNPRPRPFNEFQVAARLNKGVGWFRKNRERLEAEGFPCKDDLLDGWDSKAINLWMDRRSHIESAANDGEADLLERIRARAS